MRKTIAPLILFLFVACGFSLAGESTFLNDCEIMDNAAAPDAAPLAAADNEPAPQVAVAACEPPPPVCPPPPPAACEPPPPACPPPAPVKQARAPKAVVQEACPAPEVAAYKVVAKKRRTYQDEAYVVEEKRVSETTEVRARAGQTHSPRLARMVRKNNATIAPYKPVPYVETYEAKVRVEYTEPVVRTRKVAVDYEELVVVPDRRRSSGR